MDVRLVDLTLHEALAILEDDDSAVSPKLFIEPPEVHIHSDEDSAEEDSGGFINNLSGRQLNSGCEVRYQKVPLRKKTQKKPQDGTEAGAHVPGPSGDRPSQKRLRIDNQSGTRAQKIQQSQYLAQNRTKTSQKRPQGMVGDLSYSSTDSDDSSSSTDNFPARTDKNKSKTKTYAWARDDLSVETNVFPEQDFSKFRDKSPIEIFEMFFTEEIVEFLANESSKYAAFLNVPNVQITPDDIRCFIAVLILSGYCCLPGKDFFWDSGDDIRNTLVYNAIRRDEFRLIMRFFHCADNNLLDRSDKLWKLRPLICLIKQVFAKNFIPTRQMNYDESMVKYFGKHSCKQFIRGKPIRFGFKVWCLNTPQGYLVDFDIYQGRSFEGNKLYDNLVGKSSAPLLIMLDNLPEEVKKLPISLYFDNLFTCFPLLTELKSRGYEGTGTVRDNRLPKGVPLVDKKRLCKEPRDSYDFVRERNDNFVAVRWVDNSVVTVLSTCHGVEPVTNVTRYSRVDKKKIHVSQPAVFSSYNKFMGGTDLMDQNINRYRVSIRRKKWWWSIWTYLLDALIVNGWTSMKNAGSDIQQLAFRREIVQVYLKRSANVPKAGGRIPNSRFSSTDHRVADDIRYDGRDHLLVPCDRRRCAYEYCSSRARSQCIKCDVGLCLGCNLSFHTRQ